MNQIEKEGLIHSWVTLAKAEKGIKEDEDNFWAFCKMDDLIYDAPDEAWELILGILNKDDGTSVVELLSAGPLEDLLAEHGDKFIERIESEARRNTKFSFLLGGVWQNAMSDEVWERVQAVWTRKGWDGN